MNFVINQEQAKLIDQLLVNRFNMPISSLMEIAGLSVAVIISKLYLHNLNIDSKILIICGPGNNGGDGLVAARYLRSFNFTNVEAYIPVVKQQYEDLLQSCEAFKVNVIRGFQRNFDFGSYSLIVDAIFGFSFVSKPKSPFQEIIESLSKCSVPIVSIDIPSGWSVEDGPNANGESSIHPDTLISLTAPKPCTKFFNGKFHVLAGRFIPLELQNEFPQLKHCMSSYNGTDLYAVLSSKEK